MSKLLGKERLPMLILDKKPEFKNKNNFNAKIAAIIGFSILEKIINIFSTKKITLIMIS